MSTDTETITEAITPREVANSHHITHGDGYVVGGSVCSFKDFASSVRLQATHKVDVSTSESDVRLDSNLKLPTGVGFTPYGLETLASYTKLTPSTITNLVNQGYDADVAGLLNDQLNKRDIGYWEKVAARQARGSKAEGNQRSFLLRKRHDEDGNDVVRAVVSERYGVLDNKDVIDFLEDALPSEFIDGAVTHKPTDDGDNIFLNLFVPDENESGLHPGLHIRNSEVRKSRFVIDSFLFRDYCTNGAIFGKTSQRTVIDVKHIGAIDLTTIRNRVRDVVTTALKNGKLFRAHFLATQEIEVKSTPVQIIAALTRRSGLTHEQGLAWFHGYEMEPAEDEKDLSAWHIVNGLTRGAQKFDAEAKYTMESVAGNLVTPALGLSRDAQFHPWERYNALANTVTAEDVKNYLVRAA